MQEARRDKAISDRFELERMTNRALLLEGGLAADDGSKERGCPFRLQPLLLLGREAQASSVSLLQKSSL